MGSSNLASADVCLAVVEYPVTPEPGSVISGTVFLVAAIEAGNLATHTPVRKSGASFAASLDLSRS